MRTAKFHKVTIRQKAGTEGRPMTGSNVELLLDGRPWRGVSKISLEVGAGSVAKVTAEMYAEVDADGNVLTLGDLSPQKVQ